MESCASPRTARGKPPRPSDEARSFTAFSFLLKDDEIAEVEAIKQAITKVRGAACAKLAEQRKKAQKDKKKAPTNKKAAVKVARDEEEEEDVDNLFG